jgi:hypothetical protein
MSFETSSKIAKALHPDYKPSDQERAEAFKAYSQWKQEGSKARRRESTPQAPATFRRSP